MVKCLTTTVTVSMLPSFFHCYIAYCHVALEAKSISEKLGGLCIGSVLSLCVHLPVAVVWHSSWPRCTRPVASVGRAAPSSAASERQEWHPSPEVSRW